MIIVSVYDKKAVVYSPLMVFPNKVYAIRAFEQMVTQKDSNLNKYPADFCLVSLGLFDEKTGFVDCAQPPKVLLEASEFLSE